MQHTYAYEHILWDISMRVVEAVDHAHTKHAANFNRQEVLLLHFSNFIIQNR